MRMRSALVLLGLLVVLSPAHGFLWSRQRPVDTNPAEQTARARPLFEQAVAAQDAGRTRRALGLYKRITKRYPASAYSAPSLYNTALIEYQRKRWKRSFAAFQTILVQHPEFPKFNELVEYQFRIALAQAEGDGVRFAGLIPYRALNRAVEHFEAVINNAPYSELAPLALMNVALIHQYKGQTAEAIDALDRLINNYPNSLLAEDAYLSLAETFATLVQGPNYDQGATREAISYFEDFLILFSDNLEVARAERGLAEMKDVYARSKFVIGQYYFRHRRWYNAAEIFFNEAITIAPDSPAAADSRAYLARIAALRQEQPDAGPPTPDQERERSFIRRWMGRILPG